MFSSITEKDMLLPSKASNPALIAEIKETAFRSDFGVSWKESTTFSTS